MASDDKKPKLDLAPKGEAAKKENGNSDIRASKTKSGETAAAAPSNYSRGEGQKPVTKVYKDNWNAIFRKKKR